MGGPSGGSGIDFDAGDNTRIREDFEKRRPVLLLLTNGFVVEDYATDVLSETGCGDDPFPIRAPGFHRLGNAELREALITSDIALIHCQQTFVVGEQLADGVD